MNFKGKFENIAESTLTRYQQGGLMIGDVVKIKPNALKHPKIKDMGENVKGNIKMLMDTDLHLRVKAIKSEHTDNNFGVSDGMGLGYGATFSPNGFWIDVAVEHAPGLTTNPITLPIEVLERMDFGANLPPIPDSLKRKGNVNIKPIEVKEYDNNRGEKFKLGESIEDIYSNMQRPKPVTVRVPLEDSEDTKSALDNGGVTWSVIGPNRFELHGSIENIQNALNSINASNSSMVNIEVIGATNVAPKMDATQYIPTDTGKTAENPTEAPKEKKFESKREDKENLEEAYARISGMGEKVNLLTISIPNAFADNVKTYLAQEGISNKTQVNGNITYIEIMTTSNKETVEESIRKNVLGDLAYLKIFNSNQQISENN